MRSTILTTLCLFLVAIALSPAQSSLAQVQPELLNIDVDIPGSGGKYPDIDGYSNVAHVVANPEEKIFYWSKQDPSASWPGRQQLGTAGSNSADFATGAVTTGPDGTVYVAWIDQDGDAMYLRRKAPGATSFEGSIYIGEGKDFPVFIDIAVTTSGLVFIVWNASDRIRYRYSADNGTNWSDIQVVSDKKAADNPYVDAGPNGSLLVSYWGEGKIYASRWNGSGFTTDTVASSSGGDYFAQPSGTIAPDGSMYVAWRSVEEGRVFYAERQPSDTAWRSPSRLASGGDTFRAVSVTSDAESNIHIFWINNRSGDTDVYYVFKPVGGAPQSIIRLDIDDDAYSANVKAGTTVSDKIYIHAVYEAFESGVITRYARAAIPATVAPEGTMVLNDNVASTRDKNVSVTFNVTKGNADQYQLSNDNVTFTDFASLPDNRVVAWALGDATGTACEERAVVGRIRRSDRTDLVSQLIGDSIIYDPGADVVADARNPYLATNPTVYDEGLQQNELGASDGDPRYTRVPAFFLEVTAGSGECSGLKSYTVSDGTNTTTAAITDNVARPVTLPALTPDPVNNLTITVTDGLDWQRTFEKTIYYDNVAPVVVSGTMEVVDLNDVLIDEVDTPVVTLKFRDVQITDNLYGSNGERFAFWGLFLANSPEPIDLDDEAALAALTWFPVPNDLIETEPDDQLTFEVEWSLFAGLPKTGWEGGEDYQIIGAVVDGAGNVSIVKVADVVTLLENFALPTLHLPLIKN